MDASTEALTYLDRVLVPLMNPDVALDFLRQAAPEIIHTLETEVLAAVESRVSKTVDRLRALRQAVTQAANESALYLGTDPVLLPEALLDPDDSIWEQWQQPDLREKLRRAQVAVATTEAQLQAATPKTMRHGQLTERLHRERSALLEVQREVMLAWLQEQEDALGRKYADRLEIAWRVQTRLQVPVVTGNQVVDFVDAEMNLMASAPEAFVTRTFAVVVVPEAVALVSALRRINTVAYFLPPETAMVAVTLDERHVPVLKQHDIYAYLPEVDGGD